MGSFRQALCKWVASCQAWCTAFVRHILGMASKEEEEEEEEEECRCACAANKADGANRV